jgi:monoamine oxidase
MYDVVIVGAGASGIAAARLLIANNVKNILLVEARNRIGGRTWTVPTQISSKSSTTHSVIPLELGAEFIHGEAASTMHLVSQLGVPVVQVVRKKNLWMWDRGQGTSAPVFNSSHSKASFIHNLYSNHRMETDETLTAQNDLTLLDYLRKHMEIPSLEDERICDVLLAQTCCAHVDSLSAFDLKRYVGTFFFFPI